MIIYVFSTYTCGYNLQTQFLALKITPYMQWIHGNCYVYTNSTSLCPQAIRPYDDTEHELKFPWS